ncbi:hypothetical protein OJAV_G00187790 [Oryzias javanicus]|uniref:Uncharacterized protein n=1 Tax=Oryzias javanicus TaxID=123683 RepID=A0A3S2LR60_ORYJA|nr:hypothetical protein OJAV_G00187790 [Oryzias javanicus]
MEGSRKPIVNPGITPTKGQPPIPAPSWLKAPIPAVSRTCPDTSSELLRVMSLSTNGKARETQADAHRIQTDDFFDEFLGEVETQNHGENPAVFTGPVSVDAPPGTAPKQGKLSIRKTFHQDQSVRPPGFPNRSKAPAAGFRPKSVAAAAITGVPREAVGQTQQRPRPQPNPQPQPLTSASQTTLQPVNERPAPGNPQPISEVQAGESQSERPAGPEKHADSELRHRVPTTKAAPKKRKRETVDVALKKIHRRLYTTTPEDNEARGVSEDPACVELLRRRLYLARMMTRTLMMIAEFSQNM